MTEEDKAAPEVQILCTDQTAMDLKLKESGWTHTGMKTISTEESRAWLPCHCGAMGLPAATAGEAPQWDVLCINFKCGAKTPMFDSMEAAVEFWKHMMAKL